VGSSTSENRIGVDGLVQGELYFFFSFLLCIVSVGFNEIDRDRFCGLVVRVFGYRSGGPGSIPGTTRFSEK
jgi:hypothetical protein